MRLERGNFLKKITKFLFIITGVINSITSMLYFSGNKTLWGVTYLFLALTFIMLGISSIKRAKK